jgi:hypothetical protein
MMVLVPDAPTMLASLVLLHVLVMPAFAIVWLGLFTAAQANDAAASHARVVVGARLDMRFELHELGGAAAAAPARRALARMLPLLDDVERALKANAEDVALRILGLAATPSLAQTFLGICVSVETAVASLVVGRVYSGGVAKA